MKLHSTRFMLLAFAAAGLCIFAATANAGDLEPPGTPAPTMKTLDEIPGSWHRVLDSTNGDVNGCNSDRFKCVMNNDEAVLDLETGLVWWRDSTQSTWSGANNVCSTWGRGGRAGWRLPAYWELSTIMVSSGQNGGTHTWPMGHPFLVTTNGGFWTSTEDDNNSAEAFVFRAGDGSTPYPKGSSFQALCVRAAGAGRSSM